jgi:hypothetical protein
MRYNMSKCTRALMKSSSPKPSCTPKTNLQTQWFLVMVVQMANTSNLWLLLKCGLFLSLSILSINLEWKHFPSSSQSLKRIFESIGTSNLQPLQNKLLPRVNFTTKSTKSMWSTGHVKHQGQFIDLFFFPMYQEWP